MQRPSDAQLDLALDAFNTYGYTVEREGKHGVVVFDNADCYEKLVDNWRTTLEIFSGCTIECLPDGILIIELGTLH